MKKKMICNVCGQELQNEKQLIYHKTQHTATAVTSLGKALIWLAISIFLFIVLLALI